MKNIAPRVVYTFDEFYYEEVDGQTHIRHSPCMTPPDDFTAGPAKFWDYLVCAYTVSTLGDGTKIVSQPLPKWKLEKAMKTSKTVKEGTPWKTHPDEQCLKTVVKHTYKLLPQTERMSQAINILNEHEGIEKTKKESLEDRFGFNSEDIPEAEQVSQDRCEFCGKDGGEHDFSCPSAEPPQEM